MPVVGGSKGNVARAVQAQALDLGRVSRERRRRHNFQHVALGASHWLSSRSPHRGIPRSPHGGRRDKGKPVLVRLPQQPVGLVYHLRQEACALPFIHAQMLDSDRSGFLFTIQGVSPLWDRLGSCTPSSCEGHHKSSMHLHSIFGSGICTQIWSCQLQVHTDFA